MVRAWLSFGKIFFLFLLLGVGVFVTASELSATPGLSRTAINDGAAVDVGLDPSSGVTLDFVEDGVTHKVLEIDLGSIHSLSSQQLLFLVTDLDFDATSVKNKDIFVQRERTVETPVYSCTTVSSSLTNGSTSENETCMLAKTVSKNEVYWEPISLRENVKYTEVFTGVPTVTGRVFRLSFDVPLHEKSDGSFGNAGTVFVGVDGTTYVNKQHSSWWNTTFQYRRNITINNVANEVLRKWYTVEVSGLDTTNATKWNQTNKDNFAVVCNGIEVDKLLGNLTELKSAPNTNMYPDTTGYARSNTTFLFRLPVNISASTYNGTLCYVYYGNLGFSSPENNMSEIALLYDDFNRPDDVPLGNGWKDQGLGFLDIVENGAEDVISNNGRAKRPLDVGNCTDCEKYEILYHYNRHTASSGSGMPICFTDSSVEQDTYLCYPQGPNKGVSFRLADEANAQFIESVNSETIIKSEGIVIPQNTNYTVRIRALDDIVRGDFIGYRNETQISWSTNDTNATSATGFKWGVHLLANRIGSRMNYIMVRRMMETSPVIGLAAEQNQTGGGGPC